MAKPAKPASAPAPAETEAPVKPKSKILVLALIGVLVLGAAGGAGWYFLKGNKHADEPKAAVVEPPTFLVLEPFTVNLQHEESDQFLQIGITLKVSSTELSDKIRQSLPEVRSRLIFLLSSKKASELIPIEGKKKLARDIAVETNSILGLRTAAPKNVAHENNPAPNPDNASSVEAATASGIENTPVVSAPEEPTPSTQAGEPKLGVLDVLFTSFIIQ